MSKIFKISNNHYIDRESSKRVDWLDDFADRLNKLADPAAVTAVEVARQRSSSDKSIYDQISSIVSGRPVFSSVQGAVEDLHRRTGLSEYLKRVNSESNQRYKEADNSKKAFVACVFSDDDNIKERVIAFVKNLVNTHNGHIAVPAVQCEILDMFARECSPEHVNNDDAAKLISDIISSIVSNTSQQSVNHHLGRGVGLDLHPDADNTDFLKQFMPNKM
jgi:hypothetical protein